MAVGSARGVVRFLPVGAALFCIQLDFFSLSLALPSIAADLGTATTNLQWLLSGYMVAVGSLLIPGGRLGDLVGRRAVLLAGVAVFGLTSLVCGLVTSAAVLIAARVAQGVGAAVVLPNAFALVTNATSADVRPRVIGSLIGIGGVGTALGPVVGGVLASSVSWRWVFLLNVPVAAVALLGGLRLPESRSGDGPRRVGGLDWAGVVCVVAGLALVSIGVDDVGVRGWTSPGTVAPLLLGLAALVAFAVLETRVREPLVRPALLRDRRYVVLVVTATLANVGTVVSILAATLELQNVRGLSAATSGLLFFVASVGLALCGPLSGRLSAHHSAGGIMAIALLLAAPSLVLLALAGPLPLYTVALGLCGITTGMGYSLGELAVQNTLPPERSAEGTSVLLTILTAIGGVGVVVATAVIEALGGQRITSTAIGVVLAGTAALLLLAGATTLLIEFRLRRDVPMGAHR
jgi:MFS family permease